MNINTNLSMLSLFFLISYIGRLANARMPSCDEEEVAYARVQSYVLQCL